MKNTSCIAELLSEVTTLRNLNIDSNTKISGKLAGKTVIAEIGFVLCTVSSLIECIASGIFSAILYIPSLFKNPTVKKLHKESFHNFKASLNTSVSSFKYCFTNFCSVKVTLEDQSSTQSSTHLDSRVLKSKSSEHASSIKEKSNTTQTLSTQQGSKNKSTNLTTRATPTDTELTEKENAIIGIVYDSFHENLYDGHLSFYKLNESTTYCHDDITDRIFTEIVSKITSAHGNLAIKKLSIAFCSKLTGAGLEALRVLECKVKYYGAPQGKNHESSKNFIKKNLPLLKEDP